MECSRPAHVLTDSIPPLSTSPVSTSFICPSYPNVSVIPV